MDGIRYDRQTVGRVNSPRTLAQKKAKGSAWYDKPTEWLGAATGAVENAFRLPEDASNPMTWAKGVGGAAKSFLYDPLKRTFSGEEAMQNYLNPRGGFGPSRMAERASGVMSDALNVMSVLPVVGQAARGSVSLENALARKMAGQGFREAPMVKAFNPEAAKTAAKAGAEALKSENEIRGILRDSSDRSLTVSPVSVAPVPEGHMRVWHTRPAGDRLPSQLMSVEQAARIPERRGSGASQLLHGGLYTTEGRVQSASYGVMDEMSSAKVGPIIPQFVQNHLARIDPTMGGQVPIPSSALPQFEAARSRALLDSAVDVTSQLDDAVRTALKTEYISTRLDDARLFGLPKNVANEQAFRNILRAEAENIFRPGITWDEVIDVADTGLSANAQENWKAAVFGAAGKGMRSPVPLAFRSDTPVMYRGQLVDSANPYYLFPEGLVDIDPSVQTTLARRWGDEQVAMGREMYEKEVKDLINDIIVNASDTTPVTGENAEWWEDFFRSQQQRKQQELMYKMKERADFVRTAYNDPWMNPYNAPAFRSVQGGEIKGHFAPGQNYWDLPVTRNGPQGGITELGGMRAFDLGNITPTMADELADAATEFLEREIGSSSEIGPIVDLIQTLPGKDNAEQLETFRQVIGQMRQLMPPEQRLAEGLSNREKIYNFFTDRLNIGSMPHPGGVTVGGLGTHQAVAFNRPELLPPTSYVPGAKEGLVEALDRYNAARLQRYNAEMLNRGAGQPFVGPRPVNPAIANMAGRMATNLVPRAVASSTPQRRR